MIVKNLQILSKKVAQFKKQGKKIVFTNGCFDILHKGHVIYLEKAKRFGGILIVGINNDASVKKLKGPKRPIMPLESRAAVLGALRAVDIVVPFEESDPIRLIEIIKPNVHVKGGDYESSKLPEYKSVLSGGGKVKIVKFVEGFSVTSIINRILREHTEP